MGGNNRRHLLHAPFPNCCEWRIACLCWIKDGWIGDVFTKLHSDGEEPVFHAVSWICCTWSETDSLISFTKYPETRPEITKISRNITAPNPTQHTSLPDVTQETRGSLWNATLIVIDILYWGFTMCLAQGTKDFPGSDSLHPPQTVARETDYTPPYRLAQMTENPPAMQKAQIWFLCWEDPLEKGMATHSRILAWRIPRTEEPGRLTESQTRLSDTTDWSCTHLTDGAWTGKEKPLVVARNWPGTHSGSWCRIPQDTSITQAILWPERVQTITRTHPSHHSEPRQENCPTPPKLTSPS